jgi:hypothetical protein
MSWRSNEIRGVKIHEVKRLLWHLLITIIGVLLVIFVHGHLHHFMVSVIAIAQIYYFSHRVRINWRRWFAKPDYVISSGVAVWTGGLEVSRHLMEGAIERFVRVMLKTQKEVNEHELSHMLRNTGIEWEPGSLYLKVGRYEMFDKYGIQHGYRLILRWPGSISESSLYHELLHEVNEMVRLPRRHSSTERMIFRIYDCQHEEQDWWKLEDILWTCSDSAIWSRDP